MKCESAQLAVSAAMDERDAPSPEVEAHAATCPACSAFRAGAWRLRELSRFEVAPPVPDLVPRIVGRLAREPAPGPPLRLGLAPRPHGPIPWRRVAAGLAAGFIVGAVLTAGGVIPRPGRDAAALASEIPSRLVGAATNLEGFRARFEVTELHWTTAVPRRTFLADLWFRAPESFRVRVRDTTRYPSGAWPRNDLQLVTDGRSWRATGPSPCPRGALPACPEPGSMTLGVTGRPPFDPGTVRPTDVIVPMTVLAALDRVEVLATGRVAGRPAVAVRLSYRDATPLFQYLRFLGSWRPFFPEDRVVVWLGEDTWFPLKYEVFPAAGPARARWAAQAGFPPEPPGQAVFSAAAASLDEARVPAASTFHVGLGSRTPSEGFRDRPVLAMPTPAWTDGLERWRTGGFERTTARPFDQTEVAFARGLSWITVTRVARWSEGRAFGVGPFAEPVRLANGFGFYEAATAAEPRRVALHTTGGELLMATNLPRAALLRSAGSLPVTGLPLPRSWRVRRWAGGVTESGLSPAEGLALAGFSVVVPASLPPGYRAAAAQVTRSGGERTLTLVYRRPAAELDGVGLVLFQSSQGSLPPPEEQAVQAVRIGSTTGRWSPQRHLLEWTEGGRYRSLSSPGLDLATLVRVAASLREAGP